MSAQPSYESQLSRAEALYHAQVSEYDSKGNLTKAAVAIAAAFLGYRWYMQRKLKEELKATDTSQTMYQTIMDVYESYQNIWIKTVLPHLVSGYADGLIDVHRGNIPSNVLVEIAEGYAQNLGQHINEVSAEAMAKGFQAQLNRKVPPARALQRVLEAFGVPPRTMNTLVNVWSQEEPKITSSVVPLDHKRARASLLIQDGISVRSKMIGENETWSVREQAKQIVWMYGVQTGTIPETATRSWVTARDELVCPTCGPMHQVQVPVTEEFKVPGFGKVWAPPLHPNCRCDVKIDLDIIAPIRELQTVGKSAVSKSGRKVETPEGAKWYGQPIGSRITAKQERTGQARAAAPEQRAQRAPAQTQTRTQGMTYESFRELPAQERLGLVEHLLNTRPNMSEADLRALSAEVDYAISEVQAEAAANAPAQETERVKLGEPTQAKVRLGEPAAEKITLGEPVEAKVTLGEPGAFTLSEAEEEKETATQKVTLEETEQVKKPKGVNPDIIRMEKPMWTYIDPGQVKAEKDLLGRKVAVTGDQNRWQASSGYGRMAEVLGSRVSMHWDSVINDQLMYMFNQESTNEDTIFMDYRDLDDSYHLPGSTYIYLDKNSFVQAFRTFLSGRNDPSETVSVPVQFEGGHTETTEVFVDHISEHFNFHDFMLDNMPYLAMAEYLDASRQDYSVDPKGESASISGRWLVEEDYDTYRVGRDGYIGGVPGVHLPHRAVFLRPEYMDD